MHSLAKASISGSILLSVAAVTVALEADARACGGCFAPPEQVTVVDSHRMVISLGLEETILWDQIVYSGEPEDFVWVLPVPSPEVTIELADSEFFDALDRQSAPVIQPLSTPPLCATATSAACGGARPAPLSAPEDSPTDGVTVYDHDVIGPYETVTIGAEDPDALYTWLDNNGYAIFPEAVPAMEHYIALDNPFVVLRLRPDVGVSAMQPVRVRYPGFMGSFPLKMVVVGAQGVLDLSLWIVAEQRYEARNYGTVAIDVAELAWDWDLSRSNYADVFADTIEREAGRAWVVEYAGTLDELWLPDSGDVAVLRENITYPYVTRLRTSMLVEHIDQDLQLAPADDPGDVSNFLFAPIDINFPTNVCGGTTDDGGIYCKVGMASGRDAAILAGLMMFGVMLVLGRRRRG